ncbi:MAG: dihydrolipoyl dehydrogenase, partial [Arenimonas sp.]|nr:dihydrolipoyl dehydrogenase [Arenimonas sp.]
MASIELRVPDLGDDKDVPVIELLVAVGDTVAKDQGLVTLESAKATMEVPASAAGVITALKVKLGDTVSAGDVIAIAEAAAPSTSVATSPVGGTSVPMPTPFVGGTSVPMLLAKSIGTEVPPTTSGRKADMECAMLVLGAGPGGYTAAFRAADLGLDTVLVERYDALGGVCLNVGCIPSKALLHAAEVLVEAKHAEDFGISFGTPKIDLDKLRGHKDRVVGQMVKGLSGMAKQRKVRTVTGTGRFLSAHELEVRESEGTKLIRFQQCIIAAGSQPVKLGGFPWEDARVMDSTDALMLVDIPKQLLVAGGGIIGLEMACVYSALGSKVTVVEFMDQLMPGADKDLVKPLADLLKKRGVAVHLGCKVAKVDAKKDALHASFEGASVPANTKYDRVLVSVGRVPNGGKLGAD